MIKPIGILCSDTTILYEGALEELNAQPYIVRLIDAAEAYLNISIHAVLSADFDTAIQDHRIRDVIAYVIDVAWFEALRAYDVPVVAVAGSGVGLYAAGAVAGSYSAGAGLHMVCTRASMIHEAVQDADLGSALVYGLSAKQVDDVVDRISGVWVSEYQSSLVQVISGAQVAIDFAQTKLLDAGARRVVGMVPASVAGTPMIEPVRTTFEQYLAAISFKDPERVWASPVTGELIDCPEKVNSTLLDALTQPAQWMSALKTMVDQPIDALVEIGAGGQQCGIVGRDFSKPCYAVSEQGVQGLLDLLGNSDEIVI